LLVVNGTHRARKHNTYRYKAAQAIHRPPVGAALSLSLSLSPPLHLDPEKAALQQQRDERPECSSLGGERAPRTHETASGTAVRLQACGRNEGAAAGQWTSEARMEAVALFQASSVTCYMKFAFNFSSASRAILAVIFSSSSYALPSFYDSI
jgi:hypothetical protein